MPDYNNDDIKDLEFRVDDLESRMVKVETTLQDLKMSCQTGFQDLKTLCKIYTVRDRHGEIFHESHYVQLVSGWLNMVL